MSCDAHPTEATLFYLENSQTGDCYYLCNATELRLLANLYVMPPCGHDKPEHKQRGTWWMDPNLAAIDPELIGEYEP